MGREIMKKVYITKEMSTKEFNRRMSKYFDLCAKDPAVKEAERILRKRLDPKLKETTKSKKSNDASVKKAIKKCMVILEEQGLDEIK
jgi:CHASE3 domain sensor protein